MNSDAHCYQSPQALEVPLYLPLSLFLPIGKLFFLRIHPISFFTKRLPRSLEAIKTQETLFDMVKTQDYVFLAAMVTSLLLVYIHQNRSYWARTFRCKVPLKIEAVSPFRISAQE